MFRKEGPSGGRGSNNRWDGERQRRKEGDWRRANQFLQNRENKGFGGYQGLSFNNRNRNDREEGFQDRGEYQRGRNEGYRRDDPRSSEETNYSMKRRTEDRETEESEHDLRSKLQKNREEVQGRGQGIEQRKQDRAGDRDRQMSFERDRERFYALTAT